MKTATPRSLGAALFWAGLVAAMGGCGKVSEAAAVVGGPGTNPSAVSSSNAPSGPLFENSNYKALIRPLGPCKKNETCAVEVLVEAKGDYHINEKYPYRFKAEDPAPAGLQYPKPLVGKEDATMEERKVTLKVPFISDIAGSAKVAGTLSLSVCSAANCLMDKQLLDLAVKVE